MGGQSYEPAPGERNKLLLPSPPAKTIHKVRLWPGITTLVTSNFSLLFSARNIFLFQWCRARSARLPDCNESVFIVSFGRAIERRRRRERSDRWPAPEAGRTTPNAGADLVGGHQRQRFSLSRFQKCAHLSLYPLTPSRNVGPPSTLLLLSAPGLLLNHTGIWDTMKCGIKECYLFIFFKVQLVFHSRQLGK